MECVSLELDQVDSMREKKMKVLQERGLKLEFGGSVEDKSAFVEKMLETARILEMNEAEWYFLESDEKGMVSTRNEMAALNALYSVLSSKVLMRCVEERLDGFRSAEDESTVVAVPCTGDAEKCLIHWAKNQGVISNIFIADFEGYGRGGAAATDLKVGDLVLEIPQDLIITETVALDSDVGNFLSNGNIGPEMISLLWSMKERSNPLSKYAPYFASLPESFRTGLSFGTKGLQELAGSMVFEQIIRAKEHLHRQYDLLFPSLSNNHPDLFPESLYSWEHFLWASELWYSNSLKISFPDCKVRTCLVPGLGLLNHSTIPHITRYSKLDATTNSLKVFALRSCKAGKQCFLSYGTLPNADFLCFYGFVPENNPYDTIPIEFDIPEADTSPFRSALFERYGIGGSHLVRGAWLTRSSLTTKAGISTRLLAALRVLVMDEDEAAMFADNPRHTMVSTENEKSVMEILTSTFEALLLPVTPVESSSSWEAYQATKFKNSQTKILKSLYEPCCQLLETLAADR